MSDAPGFSLRSAVVADAPTVGALLFDFNTEFESPTPSAAVFAERFARLLAHDDVLVVLAEVDAGAAVACAYVTLRPTPYGDGPLAQLEELYVRPGLRDAGIGSAVLERVVEEVRLRGAIEMHINVDEVDVDTRRFYERHGFVNVLPGEDYRMLCYLREF